MDNPSSRPAADFIPRLEALRGVAALLVAAAHIGQTPIGSDFGLVANFRPGHGAFTALLLRTYLHLTDGLQAVSLFFVLSGFVLTLALSRSPPGPSLSGRFVVARLFRIYPAVIASVAVFATIYLMVGVQPQPTAGTVVANMLLLDTSLNGVMWSLQLEVLAIPLILATFLVRQRWSRHALLIGLTMAALLAAYSFTGAWMRFLVPFGGPPLAPLYAFLFGVIIADIGPRIAPLLTPRRATLAAIAAIAIFFAARPVLGPASNWRFIANAYGAAALILVVSYGPQIALLRVLDTSVLRFLGRVSYSFYLLHPLTLIAVWRAPALMSYLLDLGIPELVLAPVLVVVTAAVTAALAALSYAYVEWPGIAAGRAVMRRLSPLGEPRPA